MEEILFEMGKRIRQKRRDQSMTQEALADKLDTSSQYIGRIERGLVCPSLKFIYKLAAAMNCSVYALLPSAYPTERSFLSEEIMYRLNQCSLWKKQFLIKFVDWFLHQSDPNQAPVCNPKKNM